MCGIAGIVALAASASAPSEEALGRMAGALWHRGPDEFGLYRDSRAGLAHARLSIVDLTSGQQPLCNRDRTLWIVFNGEIFNYIELADELRSKGRTFRTKSDTEVIVAAYEEWGDDAFHRFNGQWAIALWNAREKKLVLARDRLGVRPLYYAEHEGRVAFASEVKSIFAGEPTLSRRIDANGLDETFTFWTVVPPQTMFEGIVELPPGSVRTYVSGNVIEKQVWQPSYPRGNEGLFKGTVEDARVALDEALHNATRLRMVRADVPVGSYLSGGLDSSLVAAMGYEASSSSFQTFSLRFTDDEYDETSFQRMMVDRIKSQHHEVLVSRDDIARVFPEVIWHTERPILRTAPAPLFLLSKLVKDSGIKVVLTGEGADEMLAGYDLFREAKIRRFWAKVPDSEWRPRWLERLYPYLTRSPVSQRALARQFFGRGLERANEPGFSHEPRWNSAIALKRLFSPRVRDRLSGRNSVDQFLATLDDRFSEWTPLAQDQYIEVRTLLSGYLLSSQGDRMLMANSVEGRFPFLDREVIELTNSFPASYKLLSLDEKHVLKRVARKYVPSAIVDRVKQPYRAPDALSFVGNAAPDWIADAMSEPSLERAGLFDSRAVSALWKKCTTRKDDVQFSNADNMAVVGVLSAQLLHRQFVEELPQTRIPEMKTRVVVDQT